MQMPQVTIVDLPRNVRALVLEASDDIRTNDPRVHGQLVDDRVKHIAAVMAFECAKIRPANAEGESRAASARTLHPLVVHSDSGGRP